MPEKTSKLQKVAPVSNKDVDRPKEGLRTRIQRQRRMLAQLLADADFVQAQIPQALMRLCQAVAQALDIARVSVWRLDPDGRCLACVVQWDAQTGFSSGQTLDAAQFPAYFEYLRQEHRIEAHNALAHPATRQLAKSYLGPNGISSMLDAAFLFEGQPAGVLCCEHIGSARRFRPDELSFASAAAALAGMVFVQHAVFTARQDTLQAKEHYAQLVETSHDVIFMLSTDGCVRFASRQWELQLGHHLEKDVLGRHFRVFLHEEDLPGALAAFDEALSGKPIRNFEYRVRHADGGWRRYSCNANASRNAAGEIEFFVCSARDITEKHEEERRRAERERLETVGRLAGGIAHEFNNMLGVILGRAAFLEEDAAGQAPILEHAAEIREAATRSARLVSLLLSFAQKQPGVPEYIDLDGAIEKCLPQLRAILGKRIELSFQPGCGLRVHMDARWLADILVQLSLRTAENLAGREGRMEIRTFPARDIKKVGKSSHMASSSDGLTSLHACIEFLDNGPPFPVENLPYAFDPFAAGSHLVAETGMRLAAVYGLVRQSGGVLQVESTENGTVFRVFFPALP